jgi:hypothetical protein
MSVALEANQRTRAVPIVVTVAVAFGAGLAGGASTASKIDQGVCTVGTCRVIAEVVVFFVAGASRSAARNTSVAVPLEAS